MPETIVIRTTVDNEHAHTAKLDEAGNGKTTPGGPDKHTHDVVAFKVQEAGDKPHTHKIEERSDKVTEKEKPKEVRESSLSPEDWATTATVRITKEFSGWPAMNAEEKRVAWGHGLRRYLESEGIPSDPAAVKSVLADRGFVYAVRALPAVLAQIRESLASKV